MYTRKQKISALLICAAFIIVTLLSTLFIIKEANHDCTGENCPICACIQQAEQTLKNLGTGVSEAVNWLLVQAPVVLAVFCILIFVPCTSLISQKVRLND